MAVLKCKMCGGDLVVTSDMTVATCQYCGTTMTITREEQSPPAHNNSTAGATATVSSLVRRGNIAREGHDFQTAVICYEKALEIEPENSGIYWNMFLARYELCNEAQLLKEGAAFLLDIEKPSLDGISEYRTAIEFATAEERKHYEAINQELIKARSKADGELLLYAAEVAVELGSISASVLQRRLKLGYGRAAMLIDRMEELGIVGPFQGSGERTVLTDRAILSQLEKKLHTQ